MFITKILVACHHSSAVIYYVISMQYNDKKYLHSEFIHQFDNYLINLKSDYTGRAMESIKLEKYTLYKASL